MFTVTESVKTLNAYDLNGNFIKITIYANIPGLISFIFKIMNNNYLNFVFMCVTLMSGVLNMFLIMHIFTLLKKKAILQDHVVYIMTQRLIYYPLMQMMPWYDIYLYYY